MTNLIMDLQQFDTKLKSALENIEVPYEPATWAALESRLDKLSAPDALDQALRPTLERMESAYDAGTWTMLANRMDSLSRIRSLRVQKVAEAAIFLLLLLNLKGFFGVVESVTHPAPQKQIVPGPIADARHGKNKKHSAAITATAETGASIGEQLLQLVQAVTGETPSDAQMPVDEAVATTASVLDPANFYAHSGPARFPSEIFLRGKTAQPLLYASSHAVEIPGLQPLHTHSKSPFYGATYASYDQNHVREGDYKSRSESYGGGLRVGYRKGKWGVETGLQYADVQYTPQPNGVIYELVPNVSSSFFYIDQVNADVFSVPVKVTRRVAKVGKTSAHAVAGLTAGFASSKDYQYHTKQFPPIGTLGQGVDTHPLPNGKGVLENGGLAQNAYLAADVGLRLEQGIGKRYTAFVEPGYRHTLTGGLGPNTARLNSFTLQAGVMASL